MLSGSDASRRVEKSSSYRIGGITWYTSTPAGSTSSSAAADLKLKLSRDGTLNAGGGFSVTQSAARNPSQNRWISYLTGGDGGQGRPQAATAAWITTPRFFDCCSVFPSRAYYLGEADTGPSGTTAAQGYYFVAEVGYNPLSNSLGVSTSQAQAASLNYPGATPAVSKLVVTRGDESLGFAGVEAIGQVNALVNFAGQQPLFALLDADPRVEQYGQVVAYPYSIFTPWDPITCTQVLVTGVASTGLNLLRGNLTNGTIELPSDRIGNADGASAPAAGLTQVPAGLAPFCLQWFNLQTLDAYRSFREQVSQAYHNDYFDNGYGYSDYHHDGGDADTGYERQAVPATEEEGDMLAHSKGSPTPRPSGSSTGPAGGGPSTSSGPSTKAAAPTDRMPAGDGGAGPAGNGGDQQGYRQQALGAGQGRQQAAVGGTPGGSSASTLLLNSGGLSGQQGALRQVASQVADALSDSPAGHAAQRLANTSWTNAMKARQVAAQAAALRAEAVLRVIVRVAGAGSPFTAALLELQDAWYGSAARLSNAAVDAAIRRLEAGLPQEVLQELRKRAVEMAAQLTTSPAVQQAVQQQAVRADGGRG
ncbi:hypothetical protein GPECTOR_119g403 [Gonium pectorale]|uniref:Uncharacterized protein n=1 Tax=Gonium pectorale TaxID=33097 RepID=A0A150FYU0_GONPE|nr:hypothetical protein GPECTOR_119g403 [Gonium pectorale]|eukprot:KXZ42772.1 hypothetical protein GPECTOR_119g403 [Gonium pectorale]